MAAVQAHDGEVALRTASGEVLKPAALGITEPHAKEKLNDFVEVHGMTKTGPVEPSAHFTQRLVRAVERVWSAWEAQGHEGRPEGASPEERWDACITALAVIQEEEDEVAKMDEGISASLAAAEAQAAAAPKVHESGDAEVLRKFRNSTILGIILDAWRTHAPDPAPPAGSPPPKQQATTPPAKSTPRRSSRATAEAARDQAGEAPSPAPAARAPTALPEQGHCLRKPLLDWLQLEQSCGRWYGVEVTQPVVIERVKRTIDGAAEAVADRKKRRRSSGGGCADAERALADALAKEYEVMYGEALELPEVAGAVPNVFRASFVAHESQEEVCALRTGGGAANGSDDVIVID
ncbi:unnamed protein product [Pedinophyceae sp. YPF-701]|nr:unnamed protein product [Pedinophyceae sp. YPF-701]